VTAVRIIIIDTSDQLVTKLNQILERTRHMATQQDIDNLAAQLDALGGTLGTALAGIQGDLDALVAANPGVDVTALTASVAALSGLVDQATGIDAENPPAPGPVV
jgi:ABC-type transporter Mla subunit MlaD